MVQRFQESECIVVDFRVVLDRIFVIGFLLMFFQFRGDVLVMEDFFYDDVVGGSGFDYGMSMGVFVNLDDVLGLEWCFLLDLSLDE